MTPSADGLLARLDLTEGALYRDGFPHDVFTALRRQEPVFWQPVPDQPEGDYDEGFWVLSRHEDILAASRDPRRFSSFDGPQLRHEPLMAGAMLVSMDGEDHARLRKLISAGFTPRVIRRLEQQVRMWAESIVERARGLGECDFVSEVAYKLPMNVIADIVGIPVDKREWLFGLADEFLMGASPGEHRAPQERLQTQVQLYEYAHQLGHDKRASPQDDVWTILSTAEVGNLEGSRSALSEAELDLFFILLVVAGSETTRNALAQGLVALLDHPDQLDRLRGDPGIREAAVEEILRWSSPVGYFARRATRDTEIRGVPIGQGDRVTMWFPSGNRDEDAFQDPFAFDIGRAPNPHVSFGGGGPHFCLGAHLARQEIGALLDVLLERTRRVELTGPPSYGYLGFYNPILVCLRELPVRMT
jgi:cholest-4-en-3-one 26-monooxygenase